MPHTSPADSLGMLRFIGWTDDATFISVSGRARCDALLRFATGARPASIDDARALRATVHGTVLALAAHDRAVLPSGFDLSRRATIDSPSA